MVNYSSITNKLLKSQTMIVIMGPTASGKTGLSLKLAELLPLEVISADSRQIFKFMDIGTAKPTIEERGDIPHHFIDYINPDEDYNAGRFGDEAEKTAAEIFNRGKIPVIVGGSGLYVKSLCEGLFIQVPNDSLKSIRSFLTSKLEELGKDYLFEELQKIDPESAENYEDRNPRRIIRALEHYYTYGETITKSRKMSVSNRKYKSEYFCINHDRKYLYKRINKRTDIMWKNGLVEETQKLLDMGFSKDMNSLNTVGYKETISFLEGNFDEKEAIEEIKKNTRRYAKRQITWNKKNNKIHWLNQTNDTNTEETIMQIMNELDR